MWQRRRLQGAAVDFLIGVVVIAAIQLPVLLTGHAYFGDWGNHLFLLDQQTHWLRSHLLPTYFVHAAETGAFYPQFLFYGGTLNAVTGRLGTVIGTTAAYKVTFVLGAAACYFGTLWAARLAGTRRLLSHLPAIVAVCGTYYLSVQYYSGGWPEFVALSMIPLVAAASMSLLGAGAHPVGATIALVAGVVVLTGSHNLTTEFALIFLALGGVAVAVALRADWRSWRRAGRVVVPAILAIGVNAWFLLPAARYASATTIGKSHFFDEFDTVTAPINSWSNIFTPLRETPQLTGATTTQPFYVQQPIFVLIWLAVVGAVLVVRGPTRARRLYVAIVVVLLGLLVLVLWRRPWDHAPELLRAIQFRFRLHSYVGFGIVALMIVALAAIRPWRHAGVWVAALGVAVGATFGTAIWQAWSAPTYSPVGQLTEGTASLPPIDYANCPAPCPTVDRDYRTAGSAAPPGSSVEAVDIAQARGGTLEVTVPPGRTVINVAWSPEIAATPSVRIAGASPEGLVVIDAPAESTTQISFHPSGVARAGMAITTACCALIILLVWRIHRTRAGVAGHASLGCDEIAPPQNDEGRIS